MEWQETIMRWIIFLLGLGVFLFAVWKRHKDGSGPQLTALLGFPSSLMVIALFAPLITSIKVGPAELGLKDQKAAAAMLLTSKPEVAEAITGEQGSEAVKKALEKVEQADQPEQLRKILPFVTQDNAVLFFPTVGNESRAYKVETKNSSFGRIETFELKNRNGDKPK